MEAIFVLWILSLSFLLIEAFWLTLTKGEEIVQGNQVERQFELFAQALEAELYQANFDHVEVRGNKLLFINLEGAQVSYEWSGGRVRRKLNTLGNDIVLLDVRTFQVQWDEIWKRLRIEVEFIDQQIYRTEISYITA